MAQPRSRLEAALERRVVAHAWQVYGLVGSKLTVAGAAGYPDRLFWLPGGRPLLVEFKRAGETLRPRQADTIRQLERLGYQVAVVDSYEAGVAALAAAVAALTLEKKQLS